MRPARPNLQVVVALVLVSGGAAARSSSLRAQEPEHPDRPVASDEAILASYVLAKAELEKFRGATVTSDVPLERTSREKIQEVFTREILDREFPEGRAEPLSRLWQKLELVPQGYDLRKELTDYLGTNRQPFYYGLERKTILVSDQLRELSGPALFNQLSYARQDQGHDLWKLHRDRVDAEDEDGLLAIKFLSEGEGQYLFLVRLFTNDGKAEVAPKAVEILARRSRAESQNMARGNIERMPERGRKSMLESLEKLERLPDFLYRRFIDPPLKGAAMIQKLRQTGGWDAVEALWKEPPTSSAQVLRPDLRLTKTRIDATRVDLADASSQLGAGWKKTIQTTLGAVGLESIVDGRLGGGGPESSKSLLGDRAQLYDGPDGASCLVWFTAFTRPDAALKFAQSYQGLLLKRHAKRKLESKSESFRATADGLVSGLEVRGEDVIVFEDCPEDRLPAFLSSALEAKKTPSASHPYVPK